MKRSCSASEKGNELPRENKIYEGKQLGYKGIKRPLSLCPSEFQRFRRKDRMKCDLKNCELGLDCGGNMGTFKPLFH